MTIHEDSGGVELTRATADGISQVEEIEVSRRCLSGMVELSTATFDELFAGEEQVDVEFGPGFLTAGGVLTMRDGSTGTVGLMREPRNESTVP